MGKSSTMTPYYREMLEKGLKFQDFVTDVLIDALGIPLSSYASKAYQLKGENKQGVEIKFDDIHKDTGRLYIETAEKSNANNLNYYPSGIYRDDNTWLYIIGDYSVLYIFGKSFLKSMHKAGGYEEKEIPTSKGFVVPLKDAEKYAIKILRANEDFKEIT